MTSGTKVNTRYLYTAAVFKQADNLKHCCKQELNNLQIL